MDLQQTPRHIAGLVEMTKKEEQQAYKEVADQQICMWCKMNMGSEIHHIRYGACGRKTYRGNVILLCKTCHDKAHSSKKKYQEELIEIIDKFIKGSD